MNETRTATTWVLCSRCSGTGHHGPVSVAGGKCFGCTDANGVPAGGHWVETSVAARRVSDAARRTAAREAKESKRLAAFAARTDAAVAALVAVGFTNVRDLMKGEDMALSYAAQNAVFAIRDRGADAMAIYAEWLAR